MAIGVVFRSIQGYLVTDRHFINLVCLNWSHTAWTWIKFEFQTLQCPITIVQKKTLAAMQIGI